MLVGLRAGVTVRSVGADCVFGCCLAQGSKVFYSTQTVDHSSGKIYWSLNEPTRIPLVLLRTTGQRVTVQTRGLQLSACPNVSMFYALPSVI
jgi:hypothetical protein